MKHDRLMRGSAECKNHNLITSILQRYFPSYILQEKACAEHISEIIEGN